MEIDPSIFKAYDIRGLYPEQLDEKAAVAIGRAFVTYLKVDEVVVGRDMRLSSPQIFAALVEGLTQQGADVIDIGMVSTDQYYFACATLQKSGAMVTASHNPAAYSGFKMVRNMPYLLSGDSGIQNLRQIIETENYAPAIRKGKVHSFEIGTAFVDTVLGTIDVSQLRPLKVIADTGNGMVGPILERVYKALPVDLIGMYLDPDGSLPNHGLDPMQEENRIDLVRRVRDEQADVGFSFDGDGDRFFVIDDRGEFVPGDFLTALMASYILERHPGGKIIYDVRCSWAVPESIEAAGGEALIERVGHAFIKPRMFEEGAIFAGELSGHYYFRDFFGADSGIVPSLLLLEILSRRGPLSQQLAQFESNYFISSEINSEVADPQGKIAEIAERYCNGHIEYLDGISVSFTDWHFNVRPSNTEPLLRLNLEGKSRDLMESKRDEVLRLIRS